MLANRGTSAAMVLRRSASTVPVRMKFQIAAILALADASIRDYVWQDLELRLERPFKGHRLHHPRQRVTYMTLAIER